MRLLYVLFGWSHFTTSYPIHPIYLIDQHHSTFETQISKLCKCLSKSYSKTPLQQSSIGFDSLIPNSNINCFQIQNKYFNIFRTNHFQNIIFKFSTSINIYISPPKHFQKHFNFFPTLFSSNLRNVFWTHIRYGRFWILK